MTRREEWDEENEYKLQQVCYTCVCNRGGMCEYIYHTLAEECKKKFPKSVMGLIPCAVKPQGSCKHWRSSCEGCPLSPSELDGPLIPPFSKD